MLPLIYIIAFTVLAFLAISNLVRNLMILGADSRRPVNRSQRRQDTSNAHPELLDESGKVVKEPFLVMRSMTVDDARERLDALYKASPGSTEQDQQDDSVE